MDFAKPIYGEVEGLIDANSAKAYFKSHGIEYTEQVEDGQYVDRVYSFKFQTLTDE